MRTRQALPPVTFRPTPENQGRLQYAQRLGLVVSDVINEILDKNLRDVVVREQKKRVAKLKADLDAPVP